MADRNLNTLIDYRYIAPSRAQNGENGRGSDCSAAGGEDIVCACRSAPSSATPKPAKCIADLARARSEALIAKGGDGGFGNIHFKTSTNRAPRQYTPG